MKRPAVVATLVGILITAVLSYPTIVHPASMARLAPGDAQFSIWNVAWVAHALLHDPLHLFDANIFYPHTGTLAYSEANLVAGAIAVIPYAITSNPIAAHNVTVFVVLVAAFVAMWALVRRLTGSWLAALASAAGFTFAGCVQSRTAEIQLLMIFVFPLTFLAFHRFVDAPRIGRGVVLGLALAVAALSCGYYGIFVGLAIGFAAIWFARRAQAARYWIGFAVAVAVSVIVVAPALRPYLRLRGQEGARQVLNMEEAATYSADARSYLTTPSQALSWVEKVVPEGKEVLFPGLIVVVLAIVGLFVRNRQPPGARRVIWFYSALAALGARVSFGPRAGLFKWLASVVPFMSFIRAPARIGVLVTFGLAVAAGFGLSALLERLAPSRRARAAAILVAAVAMELFAPWWPNYRQVPPVPAVYQRLAVLPRGAVVEFLFPYQPNNLFFHTRFMFWSMWHWQKIGQRREDFSKGWTLA